MEVKVVGAGLAGVEVAWRLANDAVKVKLYEQKPKKYSPAHKDENFAELVCSNSLKSKNISTSAGMLKAEMEALGSLTVDVAKKTAVGAGNALAVDRIEFSKLITKKIKEHKNIEVINEEIKTIPTGNVIITTGPLTSDSLAQDIVKITGKDHLYFYDAAAPIIKKSSIDLNKAFFGARYQKGDPDYLNCPMTEQEYDVFYKELVNARRAKLHEVDNIKVYEGCMPIEQLAKRGKDAMRYGPLKPVGLRGINGEKYHGVLQLRKENNQGKLYNLVGFQTNLTFSEQKRVFSLIPALANAEFVRYGVMHRNTFINSPDLLDEKLRLITNKNVSFAGQLIGVEGYMESAASGIVAGMFMSSTLHKAKEIKLPKTSMIGALLSHVNSKSRNYQPMGANMGLLPELENRIKDKRQRYEKLAQRGIEDLKNKYKEFRFDG